MAKINENVKKVISKTKIFPVATASKNGTPNVVPIHFVKVKDDETLLIADVFMDKGYQNLKENPQVAIYVHDPEAKEAYQIKGEATIYDSGEIFTEVKEWAAPQFTAKSAVVVKVTHIYNCHPGPDLGKEL